MGVTDSVRKAAVVAGVAALALVGAAGTASAHNVLISSNPEDGARVQTSPGEVSLTFDQPVQDAGDESVNQIAVTGPGGDRWTAGPAKADGTVVSAPLRTLGPKGEYVIGYRILSADGHTVSDEVRFTLTKPGGGTPAPAGQQGNGQSSQHSGDGSHDEAAGAGEDEGGGVPVWVWIVAAVVLLGAGVTFALRTGSGRDEQS